MENLFPFRGYRYDEARVGDLSRVATQPYDKITPELLERYRDSSPFNAAHVIKNPNYAEAGRNFGSWIEEGVLRRDSAPNLYPYRQEFEIAGRTIRRTGLIGLVSLEGAARDVKGHETTMRGPLEDRLRLIRETESNDGLIFSLYQEPEQSIDRLLQEFCSGNEPVGRAVDDFGFRHTVWQLSDPEACRRICRAFRERTIYIADGHHRFETALAYQQECLERGWRPAAVESFDKRMMALFNMEAEGLEILPTHRGIRDLADFDPAGFLERLRGRYRVSETAGPEALLEALPAGGRRMGVVVSGSGALLIEPGQEPPDELDVRWLHGGILEPLLGIGEEQLAAQSHVDYFRDAGELLAGVEQGSYQLGFLLNPTRLEQVRELSERGEKMPQKSTDFFPKLLTGLVFMKMEIGKD